MKQLLLAVGRRIVELEQQLEKWNAEVERWKLRYVDQKEANIGLVQNWQQAREERERVHEDDIEFIREEAGKWYERTESDLPPLELDKILSRCKNRRLNDNQLNSTLDRDVGTVRHGLAKGEVK